ncbi:MAG: hypothetical protein AAFN11_00590 [Chloroflexota bacterium]
MRSFKSMFVLFLILVFTGLSTVSSIAQDVDLEERFRGDVLSFDYPEDWEHNVYLEGESVILYSDDDDVSTTNHAFDRGNGDFIIRVRMGRVYDTIAHPAANVGYEFRAWMDYFVGEDFLSSYFPSGDIDEDDFDGRDYASLGVNMTSPDDDEAYAFFVVIEVDRDEYIVMAGFADEDDDDELEDIMLAIAESADRE